MSRAALCLAALVALAAIAKSDQSPSSCLALREKRYGLMAAEVRLARAVMAHNPAILKALQPVAGRGEAPVRQGMQVLGAAGRKRHRVVVRLQFW